VVDKVVIVLAILRDLRKRNSHIGAFKRLRWTRCCGVLAKSELLVQFTSCGAARHLALL